MHRNKLDHLQTGQSSDSPTTFPVLPQFGFLRLRAVLDVYPVSRSTWWSGVKAGRYPKPVRLSRRVVAWDVREIRALIEAAKK
jgi:prophage regulatory protein